MYIPPELGNLLDIKTMLAETVMEWTQHRKQESRLVGEATVLARQLTTHCQRIFAFAFIVPPRTNLNIGLTPYWTLPCWGKFLLVSY